MRLSIALSLVLPAAATLTSLLPALAGTPQGVCSPAASTAAKPRTLADQFPEEARRIVEEQCFAILPPEQQAKLMASGVFLPRQTEALPPELAAMRPLGDEGYAVVRRIVTRDVFDRMMPVHQRAIVKLMEDQADGKEVPSLCFAPNTDEAIVMAFRSAANGPFNERFQLGGRWSTTVTNTTATRQGDRVTLTYSFIPDGTLVPTLTNATAASNLIAFMNSIYGQPATWQAVYAQVLARWSELIGVTYIYEPTDDGAAWGTSGARNVRGDCRFAGTTLDGNFNVLAFNYFPGNGAGGDMVLDTADSFFSNTAQSSRALRNVLAHEHGHGLGMEHVCPINQSKLMEPTAYLGYDGPQFDDILSGQRNYGDPLEPNDSTSTAYAVSTLDATTRNIPQLISIDGTTDVDVFRFDVAAPGVLTVTATPQGTTYLNGEQNSNGSCSAGTAFDALRVKELSVVGLNSSGAQTAASPAVNAGSAAALTLVCPSAGTYYARVAGGTVDNIQAYRLSYSFGATSALVLSTPTGSPAVLSPTDPTPFVVRIQSINSTVNPSTPALMYRYSGGAYTSVPLAPSATNAELYTAILPAAPCGSTPQFFVTATTTAGLIGSYPTGGASSPLSAVVGSNTTIFTDDFETNKGWTYGAQGDTATSGIWIRDVPVATAAQPGTPTSGTRCAVTGNAAAGAAIGTNDVDGGFTTLVSPKFDLSDAVSARVSYQRWFTNNQGSSPNLRLFWVDVSNNDGGTWTRAETVGPTGTTAAWIASGFDLPSSVAPTANMRVRFVADDTGAGSLVEAAVDDFVVTAITCQEPVATCPVDRNDSGGADIDDIFLFLNSWFAGDPSTDFDGQGGVTIDDIFTFLNAWFTGC